MVDIIDGTVAESLEEMHKVLDKARRDEWELKGSLTDFKDARF